MVTGFVPSVVHAGPKFWLILLCLSLSIFFSKPLSVTANGNSDHSLGSNYLPYPIHSALHAPLTLAISMSLVDRSEVWGM